VELQRSKGSLQVSDLGLEIVYRLSDGRLQFRGFGPGWGVVSDLDNGGHGDLTSLSGELVEDKGVMRR